MMQASGSTSAAFVASREERTRTALTAGMAMKSEPVDIAGIKMHRPGTLIGKALEPLKSGEGEILVLLSLQ